MTKTVPLFFDAEGTPTEGCKQVHSAAQGWLEGQLGREVNLKSCHRVFVVIDTDGISLTVTGVGIINYVPDVMFHVANERATLRLHQRMNEFLENAGICEAMVYIEPRRVKAWKSMIVSKAIKPAFRWLARVGR